MVRDKLIFTVSVWQEFAGEGLRTLVLAYKDLDEDVFDEWIKKLLFASTALENREEKLGALYEEIEQGMMVNVIGKITWHWWFHEEPLTSMEPIGSL